MTLEEQLIQEYGRKRPFKVPDNYFENFTTVLMSRLPECEASVVKMNLWKRYRTMIAAAACFIGLATLSGTYLYMHQPKQGMNVLASQPTTTNTLHTTFDQAADYMMIDTDDMYSYLAEY